MTLRKSETVLRLIIGLALGVGFVGFATHSAASTEAPGLVAEAPTCPEL